MFLYYTKLGELIFFCLSLETFGFTLFLYCSSCIDTIKAIYGSNSNELDSFNHAIWSTSIK